MITSSLECPVCGGTDFIHIRGEGDVCRTCGYVLQEREISYHTPYKKTEDRPINIGRGVLRGPREYYEVQLQHVYDLITNYGELLSLPPQDIDIARKICRRAIKTGRWNKEYLALASLYIANRFNMIRPVPIAKYAEVFTWLDTRKFRRYYKKLIKTVKIPVGYRLDEREIYAKFYQEFGRDEKAIELIRSLSIAVRKYGVARNKSPKTVYAAIAYIAYKIVCDQKRRDGKKIQVTLKKAAKIAGLSESAIREAVKEVMRNLFIEIGI